DLLGYLGRRGRLAVSALLIGLCLPGVRGALEVVTVASRSRPVPTARGLVVPGRGLSADDFAGDFTAIVAQLERTPPGDAFFFYPFCPMLPYLTGRRHVAAIDVMTPAYTPVEHFRETCARAVFFGRIGDLFSRIKTDGDAVRGRGRSEAADAVQHASVGRFGGVRPDRHPAAPPLRLDGPLPRRALEAAGSGGARPGPRRRPPGLLGFPTAHGADVRPHPGAQAGGGVRVAFDCSGKRRSAAGYRRAGTRSLGTRCGTPGAGSQSPGGRASTARRRGARGRHGDAQPLRDDVRSASSTAGEPSRERRH